VIDPLETVIQYLKGLPSLVDLLGDRIASKHRYGESWAVGEPSLTVRLDGGVPDLYVPVQQPRLEVRCYASDQPHAMWVWANLLTITRSTHRVQVATTRGPALLHYLQQASGPSLLFDDQLSMDFVLCFLEALVAEQAVA